MEIKTQQAWKILDAYGVNDETKVRFFEYHNSNPSIWPTFERAALAYAQTGKEFGSKEVVEAFRRHSDIPHGSEFKIDNRFVAYYGRMFAGKYPQYANLMEFRTARGLKEAA